MKQNVYYTIIYYQWAPVLLKQMVYFCPRYKYDSFTWWRHQWIKRYNTTPLNPDLGGINQRVPYDLEQS